MSVNNPNNYTLQYNIDGFGLPWQSSNIFTGITNGSNYTLRVRNANNISCESVFNNVFVNCQTVPTPVTPTPSPVPSPVSPVPTPVPSVPTPVTSCISNINFTVTDDNFGTPAQQNNTAVPFQRCGQTGTSEYIVDENGLIIPFVHNQNYTLSTCINPNTLVTLGGWTVTINSSDPCTATPVSCVCSELNLNLGTGVEASRSGNDGTFDIITVQIPYDFSSNCGNVRGSSYTLNVFDGANNIGSISETFPFDIEGITKAFTVLVLPSVTQLTMSMTATCFYGQTFTNSRIYQIEP